VKPRCDSCGETFDNVDYVVILRKRQKSDVEQHQFCCLQCLRIWLRETAETPNEERQESFCFEHDEGAKHPFKILYTDCLGQKHECRFEKLGSLIKLRARLILYLELLRADHAYDKYGGIMSEEGDIELSEPLKTRRPDQVTRPTGKYILSIMDVKGIKTLHFGSFEELDSFATMLSEALDRYLVLGGGWQQ